MFKLFESFKILTGLKERENQKRLDNQQGKEVLSVASLVAQKYSF